MLPEQMNEPTPIPPEVAKPTPFFEHKIVWVILVVFILIIAGVVGTKFYRLNSGQSRDKSALHTPIAGSWYQSNTENVRFVLPEGWAADSANNPSLPAGFKESAIVLQKAGSACIIVEAKRDTAVLQMKQISFADRVFSSYTQFDGDWWLASTSDSAKYSFSNNTRQYLQGEFRVSANLRNAPFILFMSDGSAVPDDCNSDFNALLKTVEPYYEIVRLTPSSKGVLTTEKVWDDATSDESNKSYEHLVFTADGSTERREVMKIPTDTWAGRFSVSGGKLYIPSNSIYVLDPLSGQTTQIPGTTQTDTYISSLFLRNDEAYYLAGSSALVTCLDEYHPCAADLYSIPLTGGKATSIAHSSLGGSILGYVESERAFYIRQGWGDAGCSSTSINRIVGGKEEPVVKFSGCAGDDEAGNDAYKQMQEKVSAITTKAGASKMSSKGIRIENNTLQLASGDVAGDAMFYFDK